MIAVVLIAAGVLSIIVIGSFVSAMGGTFAARSIDYGSYAITSSASAVLIDPATLGGAATADGPGAVNGFDVRVSSPHLLVISGPAKQITTLLASDTVETIRDLDTSSQPPRPVFAAVTSPRPALPDAHTPDQPEPVAYRDGAIAIVRDDRRSPITARIALTATIGANLGPKAFLAYFTPGSAAILLGTLLALNHRRRRREAASRQA